jgi:5-methylcytosine-specific restriction endonuclease McrA
MKNNTKLSKIKMELQDQQDGRCFICGGMACDLAHLLPRSLYPEYITLKENLILLCRDCHNLYDNDINFRQRQTRIFNKIYAFDEMAAAKYFKLN